MRSRRRRRRRRRRRPSTDARESKNKAVVVLEKPLATSFIPYPSQAHKDEEERPQETQHQNEWVAEKAVAVAVWEPECVLSFMSSDFSVCPEDRQHHCKQVQDTSDTRGNQAGAPFGACWVYWMSWRKVPCDVVRHYLSVGSLPWVLIWKI